MSFIIHNGIYKDSREAIFDAENRGFNYGDSVFETMHLCCSKIMFWDDHFDRLKRSLQVMDLNLSAKLEKESLNNQVLELAAKNECSKSARVKVNVYRDGAGRYTPENSESSFIIRAYPKEKLGFDPFRSDLTVTYFEEIRKDKHRISNYKTGSSMIYILAGKFARSSGFDDCLVLNRDGAVVDGIYSSAFIYKDGVICTSNVEEGCIDGIMRKQVIRICKHNNIRVIEKPVYLDDVRTADELFFTNASEGVKAAKEFDGKEFESKISRWAYDQLSAIFLQQSFLDRR